MRPFPLLVNVDGGTVVFDDCKRARLRELFDDDVWEIIEYQLMYGGVPRFLMGEFFRYMVLMCAKACFDGENVEIDPPCLRVERLWLCHLIRTRSYSRMCESLGVSFIHREWRSSLSRKRVGKRNFGIIYRAMLLELSVRARIVSAAGA